MEGHKSLLQKNMEFLVESTTHLTPLITHLTDHNVLALIEADKILKSQNYSTRCAKLFQLMSTKDERAFQGLLVALKETGHFKTLAKLRAVSP